MEKKFFGLLLALSTFVNLFPVFGVQAAEAEETYKVDFLEALGITEKIDESSYNASVSREDFAYYIANANNYNTDYEPRNRKYIDVAIDNYAFSHIDVLCENGIIAQNSDGKFRPKDSITKAEAYTMILNSMGYSLLAQARGAWPTGYLSIASDLKLKCSSATDNLSYIEAMELIYDALQLSVYNINSIEGSDAVYKQSDKAWVTVTHSLKYNEGTVESVNGTSLFTDKLMPAKTALISGKKYKVAESFDEKKFAGNYVKYFYTEDDETVVFMCCEKIKNEDYTVDLDRFYSYGNNEMTVYRDAEFNKTRRISLEDEHIIVYNGMPLSNNVSATINSLYSGKGSMTFKDSDNDGKYDVVMIENFRNFFVNSCDFINFKIYNKLTANDILDLEKAEYYEILFENAELKFEELPMNTVLSVAESVNGEVIKIAVGNGNFNGKVSSINEDGAIIDDVEYKIDTSFQNEFRNIVSVGKTYCFYLDHLGNIAYIGDVDTRTMTYGYLIKAVYDDSFSEDFVQFKIFTENNEMVTLDGAKRVKIDGKSYKDNSEIKQYFDDPYSDSKTQPQLIEFRVNSDNQISEIDTALVQNPNEDDNYSLHPVYDSSETHWYQSGRFGLKALLNSGTVTFFVPDDASSEQKYYRVGSYSGYFDSGETATTAEIYYRSKNSGYVDVMVAKSDAYSIKGTAETIMILEDIKTALNDEDEIVTELGGYSNGSYITAQVDSNKVQAGMKKGDLIATYKNGIGEIGKAEIVYDLSEGEVPANFIDNGKGSLLYKKGETWGSETYYRYGTQVSFGYVLKKLNGNVISWSATKGGEETERAAVGSGKVTVYDSNSGSVYTGDYSEIVDYEQDSSAPSRVFLHSWLGVVKGIYVYK